MVLKMTVNTLQKNLRSIDQVGRWGGEEFIVILHNTNSEGLGKIAEKLRLLAEKSLFSKNNESISVTLSGGATLARKEDSVEALVERADKLMYRSKAGGKNRITIG
ncbi:MAG TPA: GGDEF domain-containing protein, partial [Candidatus Binatia bacterium]|nr:GGDEF domain-containing protein [Candidatus Binatia bacterium]